MSKNLVEELRWRGLIHDSTPGAEEFISENKVKGYIGFDPTADSLHIGNLVPIMLLRFLQRAGHTPFALVGGATGMVGDPSGKSSERNLLDEDTLRHNQECIKKQLEQFLDFTDRPNKAVMVNNYDWFREFSFLEFLRKVGKHISVNYMMAKDSVKNRMETGISYTEFTYQLLQGYDFYHLNQEYGVRLQMGGSDQWGNITTGTELIRRMGGTESFALTSPLITRADGKKFGKSEEGNVWLDPNRTSPYKFYQFWLNVSDEDAGKLIRIFTLKDEEEILALEEEHQKAPHLRTLQKAIADEVTETVHSKADLEMAIKASQILFGKSTTEDLATLDERTILSVFEGVPRVEVDKSALDNNVTDFLSEITQGIIFSSKGEARRMIKGGGVSINKRKVEDEGENVTPDLLQNKYLLVQRGKKNYYLVSVN